MYASSIVLYDFHFKNPRLYYKQGKNHTFKVKRNSIIIIVIQKTFQDNGANLYPGNKHPPQVQT